MSSKRPESIAEYVAAQSPDKRAALKKLAAQIRKAYPKATEHISYGMPLFKLGGHPLAGFRAAQKHIGVFVWSGTALKSLGKLLDGCDTAIGTVRFTAEKPLPEKILKAVLGARAKEIKARWG